MKKLLSGSYYIVLLLGVLFVVGSFLFAKNETHFRKGEIAGHQQITPQSITQVDEMTKEYVFSGEQFTGKNICLAFYSIHLGIEVYEDGENQFDILKEDALEGIKTTYYDEYDNGYRRLLEVLKKISDIQLTKSKLMLIKNLIGNLERLGIVHILVNDETIKSWVDPY